MNYTTKFWFFLRNAVRSVRAFVDTSSIVNTFLVFILIEFNTTIPFTHTLIFIGKINWCLWKIQWWSFSKFGCHQDSYPTFSIQIPPWLWNKIWLQLKNLNLKSCNAEMSEWNLLRCKNKKKWDAADNFFDSRSII